MTKAHREQLNEVLGNQRARLDVNEMLRRSLSAALPDGIEFPESDARTRVQVQVKSLDLRQHRDEKLSLKLTATMKISWNLEDRTPSRKNNSYQHETAQIAVHVWLNAGGERFSSEVADCMDHIAAEMARDLGYPVELESG